MHSFASVWVWRRAALSCFGARSLRRAQKLLCLPALPPSPESAEDQNI